MPSYTGAGRTSTYLQEQDLHHAAKGCKKITSFFTAVKESVPEPIAATTDSTVAKPRAYDGRGSVLDSLNGNDDGDDGDRNNGEDNDVDGDNNDDSDNNDDGNGGSDDGDDNSDCYASALSLSHAPYL